jgi:ABC-type dipeptide/oligopeptide/nickel transport system permease subunit
MTASQALSAAPGELPRARRSVMRRFFTVVRGDKLGFVAVLVGVGLALIAVLAPVISPYDPTQVMALPRLAPSWTHLFGTDQLGRDVLSRTLWGARNTLLTAVLSTALAAAVGIPLGVVAGYLGRWQSSVVMRVMDVLLAFPGLLLALVVVTVLGPGLSTVVIAVAVSYIPIFGRVVYGTTRSIRAHDYIAAAVVTGCRPLRIMRKQIFPVLAKEVIVLVSSAIGWTTLLAATLNFLGFGVRPPGADWGADLANGTQYLGQAWWISAIPGIAITITILAANYMGDFFAALLDPEQLSRRRSKIREATAALATGEG